MFQLTVSKKYIVRGEIYKSEMVSTYPSEAQLNQAVKSAKKTHVSNCIELMGCKSEKEFEAVIWAKKILASSSSEKGIYDNVFQAKVRAENKRKAQKILEQFPQPEEPVILPKIIVEIRKIKK